MWTCVAYILRVGDDGRFSLGHCESGTKDWAKQGVEPTMIAIGDEEEGYGVLIGGGFGGTSLVEGRGCFLSDGIEKLGMGEGRGFNTGSRG